VKTIVQSGAYRIGSGRKGRFFLASLFLPILLCPLSARSDGNEVPGGVAGVAAREVEKRQARVESAQKLFSAGSTALADRSYGEAMDYFKAAFEAMPIVPVVEPQRRAFFGRYQSAALQFTEIKIEEARWAEAIQTLETILKTAEEYEIPDSEIAPRVRATLEDLRSHDERYNQANSPQHLARVEEVRSKLILAKGYLELGDYDRAERAYNQVLAVDPYNTAARRGLEKVERHRMDYFDTARDHARAKALSEVAAGWESPVPSILTDPGGLSGLPEVELGGSPRIEGKLNNIRIPQIEFVETPLRDVVEFLSQKAQELDTEAASPADRGVNILIDNSASIASDNPGERPVTVRLQDVPLAAALKYVTQQAGMKYRVDSFAVTIVPLSDSGEGGLVTRTYTVPPGFISSSGSGGGDAAPDDPFADPDNAGGVKIERISAKQFLQDNGVVFGEGASARFIASTSTLVVRNTPQQMLAIENLVQSARESGAKMVMVGVRMVYVQDTALKQLGMDFLLGQANVGTGTPRVFFGGGTDGTSPNPTVAGDYPFVLPGGQPVGMNPVTAGLRTGDLDSGVSIDDLIAGGVNQGGSTKAPGIFSVAGVFTDPQFQMVLRGLNQLKGTDTLDHTSVLTKPGERAQIENVREFIYPSEYDPPEVPTNFNGNFVPAVPANPTAFEMRKLGSILEVEPTVSANNLTVNVNILAEMTDFVGFINYGSPITDGNTLIGGQPLVVTPNRILMPVFDVIRETTNVTVWDGQTIAIGGYHGQAITSSRDKIPGLGDLPVVGSAFRARTDDTTRQALLIFVTVRLIDPGGNPLNAPPEEEQSELMTRRQGLPGADRAAGPPPADYSTK